MHAGLQALDIGIPKGWPEYVLHQMVTVMRGGEEVKLSKRAGSYVTLRDLIDEVGRDATRYFLIARKPDSQLVFDIDLARVAERTTTRCTTSSTRTRASAACCASSGNAASRWIPPTASRNRSAGQRARARC